MTGSPVSRIVGHLDLDYFYAQVEEVENPSLKDRPVLVCVFSGRTEDSGVVSTANYRARESGVKSGMPIALAKRRLEGLGAALIPMDRGKYEVYSDRVMDILKGEVDAFEQAGIDEAFFDITKRAGGDYGSAASLAAAVKARILKEEGLTCSIGLGPNKVVAKMASDFQKPDGLTVVREAQASAFMSSMAIEKIWGVGPKTAKALEAMGITTVSALAHAPVESLADALGKKLAVYLHDAANGVDEEPVAEGRGISQISRIVTLKQDTDEVGQIVGQLTASLADLRDKLLARHLFFKSISVIGIRGDLSLRTKSKTLETPTSDPAVMEKETRELFGILVAEAGALRRAGVRVSGLQDMADQHSLTEFTG